MYIQLNEEASELPTFLFILFISPMISGFAGVQWLHFLPLRISKLPAILWRFSSAWGAAAMRTCTDR
jgi:hypothetical protein